MSATKKYFKCSCGKKTSTTDPRRFDLGLCATCQPDLDAAPAKSKAKAKSEKKAASAPKAKPSTPTTEPKKGRAVDAIAGAFGEGKVDARAAAPKAETKTPAATATKTPRDPAVPKKLSLLSAAALILRETGETLSAKDILQHVYQRQLWTPPASGKTPDQTLGAAIRREIAVKGDASRFSLPERGKFAATSGA